MITPKAAQQIRAGLAAYRIVHTFRGYPTYNQARQIHRTSLGVLGTIAFDRAEAKAGKRPLAESTARARQLITNLQFQEIIQQAYPPAEPRYKNGES